jgi:hypothetical protein
MKKRAVVLVICLFCLIAFVSAKQVQFYFYDQNNCSLDGYVYAGDKLIGKAYDGTFNLTLRNYEENVKDKENISLFGKLEKCYDSELYFDGYWENILIEPYYFDGDSVFNFKLDVNSHNPVRRSLMGFIQPEQMVGELENVKDRKSVV